MSLQSFTFRCTGNYSPGCSYQRDGIGMPVVSLLLGNGQTNKVFNLCELFSGEILACDQSSFVAIKHLRERELLKSIAGSYVFANEGIFIELPTE